LRILGLAAREAGDVARARELLGEALALAGELHEPALCGWIQVGLGGAAVLDEDIEQATTWLTGGLAALQLLDDPAGVAWALNHLAHVAQLEGHAARAMELHAQSLPLFRGTDRQGIAWAHEGLGEAALGLGDASQAQRHFSESLRIFGELDDSAITWSLAGLAGVAVLREEPALAAQLWGAVEALRERSRRRPAPAARAGYERALAAARTRMGQTAFVATWSAGRRLSLAHAVALATRLA
jgi:tetratricopeptide (TPR) repeat protein